MVFVFRDVMTVITRRKYDKIMGFARQKGICQSTFSVIRKIESSICALV